MYEIEDMKKLLHRASYKIAIKDIVDKFLDEKSIQRLEKNLFNSISKEITKKLRFLQVIILASQLINMEYMTNNH